ncbi:MAG: DUF3887 domain-containing protein, partial [Cyanobium sp.]
MARSALLALGLLSSLSLSQPAASLAQIPQLQTPQLQSPNLQAPSRKSRDRQTPATRLSVEQARAAANRILEAIQTGDPNLRSSQFSDQLKAISSPAMVAETMRRQPKLLSWTLLSVRGGLRSTTVEASL